MTKRINILPLSSILRLVAKQFFMLIALSLMLSAFSLSSCSNDESVGGVGVGDEESPVTFSMGTAAVTRATGLETLVKDIPVYGSKGTVEAEEPSTADTRVFDNYVLWYDDANAGKTTTNTNSWEYVGSYVGSVSDGTKSDLSSTTSQTAINAQRTKYWDHSASHYYFWAIAKASQGSFTADSYGRISSFSEAINQSDLSDAKKVLYYTEPIYVPRDGSVAEDNAGNYGKVVNLVFKRMMCRARFGFYSDVKGWKVSEVHFYQSNTATTAETDNTLYIYGGIATAATSTITYSYSAPTKPTSTYSISPTTTENPFSGFGTVSTPLSASSDNPTYNSSGYVAMIPIGTRTDVLSLKCDYTLSSDDTDETITVTGASVDIPTEDCSWQSNYSYTYLFKLTKGKLKPITLDALYKVSENQGTTTTIEDSTLYTITTYQVESVTNAGITYRTNKAIDVTVSKNSGKSLVTDLDSKLTLSEKPAESTAVLSINGSKNKATFTPDKVGTYTITYKYGDEEEEFVKKVITVE